MNKAPILSQQLSSQLHLTDRTLEQQVGVAAVNTPSTLIWTLNDNDTREGKKASFFALNDSRIKTIFNKLECYTNTT